MTGALAVAAGGAVGALLRYGMGVVCLRLAPDSTWPLATFLVNVIGCFAIGAAAAWINRTGMMAVEWRLFLVTGMLGGFTTFSAFGMETFAFIEKGRFGLAFAYVFLSVCSGLAALAIGSRLFTR